MLNKESLHETDINKIPYLITFKNIWGIERSGFFNGRGKWAKDFDNQRV